MMFDSAIVLSALCSASAFLFALSLIPAKSPLSRTLEQLEARSNTVPTVESGGRVERLVNRVLPQERRGRLAQMLLEAGWYTVTPAHIVLRMIACALLAIVAVLMLSRILHLGTFINITLEAAIFAAIVYAPMSMLNRAMELRKEGVQKALPDFLDMVASTVQAGLSVNAALAYSVDAAPGALGEEIRETLSEIRLGRARAEALKAAAERLNQQEFSTTVNAITQAERLGANVGKILNDLAEDTRAHRILLVEEHAAQLPVKMVFPMAFFLLPCLFVIIFGSLVVNYIVQSQG
jgi:tight adherence protein C